MPAEEVVGASKSLLKNPVMENRAAFLCVARREENGAPRHSLPFRQPEGRSGSDGKVERAP
jgi:hypothetical protein